MVMGACMHSHRQGTSLYKMFKGSLHVKRCYIGIIGAELLNGKCRTSQCSSPVKELGPENPYKQVKYCPRLGPNSQKLKW